MNAKLMNIWLPFIAALLGTIIGAFVSIYAVKTQMASARKQARADVIQRQISRLETIQQQTAQVTTTSANAAVQTADLFRQTAMLFTGIAYMFPQELEREVYGLAGAIESVVARVQQGIPVTDDERSRVWGAIGPTYNKINEAINGRLRLLQAELDRLTLD